MRRFCKRTPIDPASLPRWRKRLGEAAVEELLAARVEAVKHPDVIIDTTAMPNRSLIQPIDVC